MTNEKKYKEIGIGLQNKYPKIDLEYHFTNCNVDDPIELGKMADSESEMWGNMLKEAQEFTNIIYRPWLLTPGFLIFVSVLAFNVIGDKIRDILDPKGV